MGKKTPRRSLIGIKKMDKQKQNKFCFLIEKN
jgi:hypothetical protein